MTDIIEALRAIVSDMPTATHRNILEHAAEDLEQQQAENHHLREAVSGRPSSELHEAALAEKDIQIEVLRADLAAAKAVIENIVESEVEPLKALLREADTEITTWMYHGHGSTESGFGSAPLLNRIRDALGDKE